MNSEAIKPGKKLYVISAVIFAVSIIGFLVVLIMGIFSNINSMSDRFVVPGTKVIELKETGKYNIYFEYLSKIDGKIFETRSIAGLKCSLKNTETGENVELNDPSMSATYSYSGREGKSLFAFSINKAGKYEFKTWYESGDGEEAVFVISKGFGTKILTTVLNSLGILFIGVGLSFGIFLYTLIKMKKYKKNIEMQQKGLY